MTVLLQKISTPYNWQENRHEINQRHNCFTPSQFKQFIHSRYYYASDTLYRIQHAKYDHKTYEINVLKQRKSKRSVAIISTIQNRINERTESNASSNQDQSPIIIERKSARRLCKPPCFWEGSKLRSVSEGSKDFYQFINQQEQEDNQAAINQEVQVKRTRKRKQCIIPQMKLNTQKKSANLKVNLEPIEEDCGKE